MAAPWPEDLGVLVPVYNHASRVGKVVEDLVDAGARVLVVDDGSTDGSIDASDGLATRDAAKPHR